MKIILFNGPPSSGKDTAAKYLYKMYQYTNHYTMYFERFSAPLKTAFGAVTGTRHNDFFENTIYEAIKDEIVPWLGVSYRQFQINLSEKHFKPLYGDDIFGKLFLERITHYHINSMFVVPDSGFAVEISVLEKALDPKNVLLIRCHREGKTFEGDSREYTYSDKFVSLDLNNNGTIKEFEKKIDWVFNDFYLGYDVSKYNEEVAV